jgi:hypothetical protein
MDSACDKVWDQFRELGPDSKRITAPSAARRFHRTDHNVTVAKSATTTPGIGRGAGVVAGFALVVVSYLQRWGEADSLRE